MLTEMEIETRLNELQEQHRIVSSDTMDPELEARISELMFVLEKKPWKGYSTGEVEEWR